MIEEMDKSLIEYAREMDKRDPLRSYRDEYYIPKHTDGQDTVYLTGNSLGLQSKRIEKALNQELSDWKAFGVEGHFEAKHPWMPYHNFLRESMAKVVGAKPHEVVVMNTLTVNLHLMMVSFYRPEGKRRKIIIESDAFPSDVYAVESQIRFHKGDVDEDLLKLTPRPGEHALRLEDIEKLIKENQDELALVMIGNTNYYTGQFFDMKKISKWGHDAGAFVGFDCAHGAGNVPLNLHESGADFAVWCTYKYLNSGPGSIAGCFVHERHSDRKDIPRFEGWWGHNQDTRFQMRDDFEPMKGADAWQLSNPPILSMAAVKASIDMFAEVGMGKLREKAIKLTGYMEYLVNGIDDDRIEIITPENPEERGCQLSILLKNTDKTLFEKITEMGVIADWRNPNVIRVAPVPMYNSFEDAHRFVTILSQALESVHG